MVNYFNEYFINVISDLTNNKNFNRNNNDPLINIDTNQDSFFFLPTSQNEVETIILSLKSKPTNLNDISIDVLKYLHKPISIIITHIFNKCIEQGIYPNKLKYAKVVPIYKSGPKYEVSNYRPISTLLSINKIFEKLAFGRIIIFINSCSLILKNQFGFQKGKSTTDAIFEVTQFASKGLNSNEYVTLIFLDLKKAFDSVSHSLLMGKLFRMGFRGKVQSFLRSYLDDRYQSVSVGEFCSDYSKV